MTKLMRKAVFTLAVLLLLNIAAFPHAAKATTADGMSEFKLPEIKSEAAVLMDADSGQVLYSKDMHKRMYPASITKIMTVMLALEYGDVTDTVTMTREDVFSIERSSSNIALDVDEQISLEQALYAAAVASANDAANGIASHIGGSLDGFVRIMNTAAEDLGAVNTRFANASGLPDDNHYTTAYDMALITARALKVPGLTEIFNTRRYEIPPTNKQPETRIFNSSNRFVNGELPYEGLLMSKAGWTADAHHTLVTAARRGDTTLVAVVLKSSDSTVKWSDTVALFDYGFNRFHPVTIPSAAIIGAIPADILPDDAGAGIDPATYAVGDVRVLLPAGLTASDVKLSFQAPSMEKDSVKIPVTFGCQTPDAATFPPELASVTVTASLLPAEEEEGREPAKSVIGTILKVILIIVLSLIGLCVLLIAFLVVRRALIRRRRRRRRQQRQYAARRG
jgi:D-alanyl-D-alanine carboxypeptidase (penicillin-binding protein 5/6)